MRHLIFCLFALGMVFNATAQENYIGFKAIGAHTNLSQNNADNLTNKPLKTFSGGITYEKIWEERYGITLDLVYLKRGGKNELVSRFDFQGNYQNQEEQPEVYTRYYNYIGMPVKAGLHWGDKAYFNPKIGIIPALLMKAGTSFQYSGETEHTDNTRKVNPFDLAGVLELVGGYQFEERFRVFTTLSARQSITSLSTSDHFPHSGLRHGGLSASLGLQYELPD